MSFLYAALCRAQNIPCRIVVGAWAAGKGAYHVWNEVYLEEKGWVPVDMTMANTLKRGPWRYITGLFQTLTPNQYFGKLEDQRVIFSVETDLEPDPTYPTHVLHDPASISKKEILRIAKRDLYWGRELLD